MPIYAYRCSNCGFQQDHLQKISDPKLTVCPNCGQETYVKQLTAAGFQLKGSGWYVTDFRDGGGKAAKKDDGKPESGEAKAGDAKPGDAKQADAKPAVAPAGGAAAAAPAPSPSPAAAPAPSPASPAPPSPAKPASS